MPHPVTILLVEDNRDDEALTVMALRGVPGTLEVARDGQETMDYLANDGKALPRLVLLDLKLPKIDGLEVLRRIREDGVYSGPGLQPRTGRPSRCDRRPDA